MTMRSALGARLTGRWSGAVAPLFAGPFRRSAAWKVLILYERRAISYAVVHPFLRHADAFRSRFGASVRLLPSDRVTAASLRRFPDADVVLLQTWLTDPPDRLPRLLDAIERALPDARLDYWDTFASVDLRYARTLEGRATHCLRKATFRDPSLYHVARHGHTNLSDHYGRLYGVEEPMTDWDVPAGFADRIRLTPTFHTAPNLVEAFAASPRLDAPPPGGREIDVHARLAAPPDGWYGRMRRAALASLAPLGDRTVLTEPGVSWNAYMAELRRSALCFSPFGFGEICWRDVEAMLAGSVVVKPDMSHLRTQPDLYVAGETYLSCAWDFSDVADVIRDGLADPDRLARIARTAYETVHRHVAEARFVDDMAFLFAR